jgi:5-methylcytosine-specific restriction protein B
MPITAERVKPFLREALDYIAQHDSRKRNEVVDHLEETFKPTAEEAEPVSQGRPNWATRFLWWSVNLTKAGWLTKDGSGVWTVTDAGRQALVDYPDSDSFIAAAQAAYKAWAAANKPPQRRAWLVRGSSILGANLVPEWIEQGIVSLAGSQLRPIDADIDAETLKLIATEDYAHLKHHELRAKVEEILAFVTKMSVGDVVLTTNEANVFVGDVTGDWTYAESDGGRSNLRRTVDWRNEDAPIDFADLPTPLPARLQSGHTVLDLTAELATIDALTEMTVVDADPGEPGEAALIRHEHLPNPSQELADALFVDLPWLAEVRDLLDERRQVIFYGPPGTGKTYIARKLAADLVGHEQVKLVQFHPAYTYEDFFEGYRPAAGGAEGTIAFELKAGPLRQLVNRAREHPDQAFVLIIDEINRANLAKVFGELYFLLEYRDEAVDLLYSADDEGFTLPKNLYLIGTMNTADRSIALVDSAMRRRFAFVALDPDTEPTKSLLGRWSAKQGLGDTAAALLAELNRRIEDPDFRIGPSYFMKSEDPGAHGFERLDRIWRTSILPLLQEHHYGEWDSIKRRYQLKSLLAAISGPADPAQASEASGGAGGGIEADGPLAPDTSTPAAPDADE